MYGMPPTGMPGMPYFGGGMMDPYVNANLKMLNGTSQIGLDHEGKKAELERRERALDGTSVAVPAMVIAGVGAAALAPGEKTKKVAVYETFDVYQQVDKAGKVTNKYLEVDPTDKTQYRVYDSKDAKSPNTEKVKKSDTAILRDQDHAPVTEKKVRYANGQPVQKMERPWYKPMGEATKPVTKTVTTGLSAGKAGAAAAVIVGAGTFLYYHANKQKEH